MEGRSDIPRTIVYLACLGAVTYLGSVHVIAGDAVVGLVGAIAGYAAGRVVNGVKR
jgi:hypothetical protein